MNRSRRDSLAPASDEEFALERTRAAENAVNGTSNTSAETEANFWSDDYELAFGQLNVTHATVPSSAEPILPSGCRSTSCTKQSPQPSESGALHALLKQ
jgi:hypothetical protein